MRSYLRRTARQGRQFLGRNVGVGASSTSNKMAAGKFTSAVVATPPKDTVSLSKTAEQAADTASDKSGFGKIMAWAAGVMAASGLVVFGVKRNQHNQTQNKGLSLAQQNINA